MYISENTEAVQLLSETNSGDGIFGSYGMRVSYFLVPSCHNFFIFEICTDRSKLNHNHRYFVPSFIPIQQEESSQATSETALVCV
jgi:hypothetical protein